MSKKKVWFANASISGDGKAIAAVDIHGRVWHGYVSKFEKGDKEGEFILSWSWSPLPQPDDE